VENLGHGETGDRSEATSPAGMGRTLSTLLALGRLSPFRPR
jgi:hypothetical protein